MDVFEREQVEEELAELKEARGYRMATPPLDNPASWQKRSEWLARNQQEIDRLERLLRDG